MDIAGMHIKLKLELDKSEGLEYPDFLPEELDVWLNDAIHTFVKTRYSGMNPKQESVEETQKRIDDLRTLIREDALAMVSLGIKPNSILVDLADTSETYWFSLSEECLIAYEGCHDDAAGRIDTTDDVTLSDYQDSYENAGFSTKRVGITETTSDRYPSDVEDPFGEFRFKYQSAKPLRLFYNNSIELISDGNYYVLGCYLRYIKRPIDVSLTDGVDCDLPEHTHDEIVKLAANTLIENIESGRFATHSDKVNKME